MTSYRRTAAVAVAALLLTSALALLVADETWDSALGALAGASTVLLLGCLLGMAVERRRRRDEVDAASLDRLEPLRDARREGA